MGGAGGGRWERANPSRAKPSEAKEASHSVPFHLILSDPVMSSFLVHVNLGFVFWSTLECHL